MWEYSYYPNSDELYHHGILGMHWGKKNGPPYPLGAADHSSSEKKAGWRKSLSKSTVSIKKKIKKKNDSYIKNKSKEYRDAGISKKNAEEYARKKQKIIAGVAIGGLIVTGAVAGAVILRNHKAGKAAVDYYLKKGTPLQTLSSDPDRLAKGKSFYTNFDPRDMKIYEGYFGGGHNHTKYAIRTELQKEVKIASNKSGEAIYKELMKNDPVFRRDVKALQKSHSGKWARKTYGTGYDFFNAHILPAGGDDSYMSGFNRYSNVVNKFQDAAKQKGYGGVLDVNDMRYSNLRGRTPTILFNDKGVIGDTTHQLLTHEQIETGRQFAKSEIPKIKKEAATTTNHGKNAVKTTASLSALGSMYVSQYYDESYVPTDNYKNTHSQR